MKLPENNQQGGGLPLSTSDLLAVAEWLTGHDTGVSSTYMAAVAISGKVTPSEWGDSTPSDAPDLGRCVRLIEKAPTVLNCFPVLRLASPVWAAYLDNWDELTALWHKGDYHITTGRMRDLRSSANAERTYADDQPMQNENTPTEGQTSDKQESESALRDAACSSSSSRRLRRFTPKELDAFQKARAKRPPLALEREDTPHIVFPKGARYVSDFPLTHNEIKAVSDLMFAGKKMQEASGRLLEVLPAGAWHQFFGNWDLLRISNREPY